MINPITVGSNHANPYWISGMIENEDRPQSNENCTIDMTNDVYTVTLYVTLQLLSFLNSPIKIKTMVVGYKIDSIGAEIEIILSSPALAITKLTEANITTQSLYEIAGTLILKYSEQEASKPIHVLRQATIKIIAII